MNRRDFIRKLFTASIGAGFISFLAVKGTAAGERVKLIRSPCGRTYEGTAKLFDELRALAKSTGRPVLLHHDRIEIMGMIPDEVDANLIGWIYELPGTPNSV